MFQRRKARFIRWLERYQQRRIEELLEETRSLKAQVLEANGGKPIRLSPSQKKRLAAKRKGIFLERLNDISVLDEESAQ